MRRSLRSSPVALGLVAALTAAAFLPSGGAGAATGAPNDPGYAAQWGLSMVSAPQAWATSTGMTSGGKPVIVGVVDTGVDLTHVDLAKQVLASTNCIGANGDPTQCHGNAQDDNGHGTHVAGIIDAITNNKVGVAGMAPGARLVVAKALDSTGSGSVADINAGIEWVVNHGATVVNLSLGDPNFVLTSVTGTDLSAGIEYAWSHKPNQAVTVLASGNSNLLGFGSSNYGSLDAVVVGAVGRNRQVASYSSPTGSAKWAVLAPGGSDDGTPADDILSTYWYPGKTNQYGYLAGTSMATPFTAGTLALLLATGMSPTDARQRVVTNVDTSVSCGTGSTNCTGLLDAAKAVAGLPPVIPPTTTTQPGTIASTGPGTSSSIPSAPTTTSAPAKVVTHPAPTPTTAVGGPPAIISATPGSHRTTTTTPVRASGAPSPPTSASRAVEVGLAATAHHHGGSTSMWWFALLAAVFALLVAGGIVRVMRTVPDNMDA
jgi:subtilisin family serine protease